MISGVPLARFVHHVRLRLGQYQQYSLLNASCLHRVLRRSLYYQYLLNVPVFLKAAHYHVDVNQW